MQQIYSYDILDVNEIAYLPQVWNSSDYHFHK